VLLPEAVTVIALGSLLIGLLALVLGVIELRRSRRLAAHYAAVMTGADGDDLAAALEAFAARLTGAEQRLDRLETQIENVDTPRVERVEARQDNLDARLRRALQHVRLLRFSAFDDSGGDQSFALALLDENSDGLVLSGLYGRGGGRVYAKPVASGVSSYSLTAEEARAIEEAFAAPESA
jgi:hypothetical protein